MQFDLVGRDTQSSGQFSSGLIPGLLVPGVDQHDIFSVAETMFQVYCSDS
jgi:hypothetical protein